MNNPNEHALLEKLKRLPPERVAEVEDFVDFLRTRGDAQQLTRGAAGAAEPAFKRSGITPTMPPTTSYSFGEVTVSDWQASGLIKPSAIKSVITTIEQALVIRRLGQLTTEDQQALRNAIAKIVG